MSEFTRRQTFSRLVRQRSELIRAPSLVNALLREERKLAQRIHTLDSDRKHSISHMESEIDFFRKKTSQQTDNSSGDDCNMSIISEAGSDDVSELEIATNEEKPIANVEQSNVNKSEKKYSLKVTGETPSGNPKQAFQHSSEKGSTDHFKHFNHYQRLHNFRNLQESHSETPTSSSCSGPVYEAHQHVSSHHFKPQTCKEHLNDKSNGNNIVRQHLSHKVQAPRPHHYFISRHFKEQHQSESQTDFELRGYHNDKELGAQKAHTPYHQHDNHHHHHRHHHPIDQFKALHEMSNNSSSHKGHYNDGHRSRHFGDDFHKDENTARCAQAHLFSTRRGHLSSPIAIDVHELTRRNCDSPVSFRSSTIESRTGSKTSHHLREGRSSLFSKSNKVSLHLNPMLFHPRFNNVDSVCKDDDYNSFQALSKCRYLRIPKAMASQEIESLVD